MPNHGRIRRRWRDDGHIQDHANVAQGPHRGPYWYGPRGFGRTGESRCPSAGRCRADPIFEKLDRFEKINARALDAARRGDAGDKSADEESDRIYMDEWGQAQYAVFATMPTTMQRIIAYTAFLRVWGADGDEHNKAICDTLMAALKRLAA